MAERRIYSSILSCYVHTPWIVMETMIHVSGKWAGDGPWVMDLDNRSLREITSGHSIEYFQCSANFRNWSLGVFSIQSHYFFCRKKWERDTNNGYLDVAFFWLSQDLMRSNETWPTFTIGRPSPSMFTTWFLYYKLTQWCLHWLTILTDNRKRSQTFLLRSCDFIPPEGILRLDYLQ